MGFAIMTDSCCDMPAELLRGWDVGFANMHFRFEGEAGEFDNESLSPELFYEKMRQGAVTKTSAVNADDFERLFEPALQRGDDILYVGFSSGLSTTFNCARIAVEELEMRYPGSRILMLDSVSGSIGEGLIVELLVEKKRSGCNLDETFAYGRQLTAALNSWFTVDDLSYLRRGGRIGAAAAVAAATLNIKPLINADAEGKLAGAGKVIGRKAALKALAQKYVTIAENPAAGKFFIAHSDCLAEAKQVDEMIFQSTGNHAARIESICPVMGSHCGPGTVALFFIGTHK